MNQITVEHTTKTELIAQIVEALKRTGLFERRTEFDFEDELLSRKEAANFLKVSLPTLDKMTKEGEIKCIRGTYLIRYRRSELLKLSH